jgi:very-short-patch-repair endonuclease
MTDPERLWRHLAQQQFGVISEGQLRSFGLSYTAIRRRVRSGLLCEILPGTFVVAGAPKSWRQNLWAAQLWAGLEAALSHRSAGALLELEGIGASYVEITTRRSLKSDRVLIHRKRLQLVETDVRAGLRVTNAARTLLDLGDVLRFRAVERAADDALHRGLVTLAGLKNELALAGGRGVRGTTILREIVDTRSPSDSRSQSTLERRLARLIKSSGLPSPASQFEVFDESGFVARVDFAYPEIRLAIEAEGYRFHRDRQTWSHDLERRSALALLGWRVLHFTWEDVHDRPAWVINQIRRSLLLPVRIPHE